MHYLPAKTKYVVSEQKTHKNDFNRNKIKEAYDLDKVNQNNHIQDVSVFWHNRFWSLMCLLLTVLVLGGGIFVYRYYRKPIIPVQLYTSKKQTFIYPDTYIEEIHELTTK